MSAAWSAIARASRVEQRRLQDLALQKFVREELYPFSAHYRRIFDERKIAPRDIRTVADLAQLPLTTKQDLLAAQSDAAKKRDFILIPSPPAIKACWPFMRKLALVLGGAHARELVRASYTPSFMTFTTGRSSDPVVFTYTPHDIEILAETGARMLDVHAAGVDARLFNMFPFAPHLAFWQAVWAGFQTGRLTVSSGGGKVMGSAGNIKLAERIAATVLIGTPGFMYHVLREARERKANLSQVKLVVLGAEKVTPGLKQKMAESLEACGASDVVISGTYGFTEARMAFSECPAKYDESPGYHVYPDLGVFEVIDPATEKVLGEGQTGELVYTPIRGHGTVVCRYRTGDVAVGGITHEPCKWCGRTVPRISSELRRSSDQRALNLTKIKGTLVDLSNIGTVVSNMPEVEEWQVVLQKKNGDPHELDEFVLRLSLKSGTEPVAFEKRARNEIVEAVEVGPNRFELKTNKEMLDVLGMETEMKEKRFLDLRPN